MKDFWGVEFFDSRMIWDKKIWAIILLGGLIENNMKIHGKKLLRCKVPA